MLSFRFRVTSCSLIVNFTSYFATRAHCRPGRYMYFHNASFCSFMHHMHMAHNLPNPWSLQKVMFPATYNHTRKSTSHVFIKDKLTKGKSKITILQQILNSFLVSSTPNVCYTRQFLCNLQSISFQTTWTKDFPLNC